MRGDGIAAIRSETQAGVLRSCSNVAADSSTKRRDEGRLDWSHLQQLGQRVAQGADPYANPSTLMSFAVDDAIEGSTTTSLDIAAPDYAIHTFPAGTPILVSTRNSGCIMVNGAI